MDAIALLVHLTLIKCAIFVFLITGIALHLYQFKTEKRRLKAVKELESAVSLYKDKFYQIEKQQNNKKRDENPPNFYCCYCETARFVDSKMKDGQQCEKCGCSIFPLEDLRKAGERCLS